MKKILILSMVIAPIVSFGQGFQVNLQGQKQQAMGGTSLGKTSDAASLFFNPGAASFAYEREISIGGSPVVSHSTYTDNNSGSRSKTTSPVSIPFTAYALFGKKESKLKYGLAVYNPFGSTINWEDGWTGRFVITHLQLHTTFLQPTFSYKLSDKLAIGAGFVYGMGSMDLKSDLPIADENGNYNSSLQLKGNGSGFGFNSGVYYKPVEKLSLGLSYRSGVKMKFSDANATFTVPSTMSANFPSGPFSTCLPLPKVISLGSAFSVNNKLTLAAELTMVGWKSYDTLSYDFKNNTDQVSDRKLPRSYENTFSYRLGGEYEMADGFFVRAGLKYLTTPVKDGKVTPEVPDGNHLSYSTGVGIKMNSKFSTDISFTYEKIKRSDLSSEVQLNGSYETNLLIPGISVSYKF